MTKKKTAIASTHNEEGVRAHLSGDLSGARDHYRRAVKADPEHATYRNNYGFLLAQLGESEAGIAQLRQAVEKAPEHAMAQSNLGQLLFARGEIAEGMTLLHRAVELDPQNVQAWTNLGRLRLVAGDAAGSEAAYRRACELEPDARRLAGLGTAAAAQGHYDVAIRHLEAAVAMAPDDAVAWSQLGGALFMYRDLGSAEVALQRALELMPEDDRARRHLALVHLARGETEAARAELETILEHDPQAREAHLELAVLELARGEAKRALAHTHAIYEPAGANERLRFYHGLSLLQAGRVQSGKKILRALSTAAEGRFAAEAARVLEGTD